MNSTSIDLRYLLEATRRQYIYFLSVVAICLVWSYSSFRLSKPNWSASFLINVEKENDSGAASTSLGQFIGLRSKSASTDVLTEVQLLQSPLVLKPVFDYVKSLPNQDSDLNFSEWVRDSINLQSVEGTSILKVTFKAENKQQVVPVLSKIISSYTEYGRDEKRNRTSAMLKHSAKVVAELQSNSDRSSRKLDSFILRHGISADSPTFNVSSIPSTGSVGNSSGSLSIPSATQSNLSSSKPLDEIGLLSKKIILRKQTFTKDDPVTKQLLRQLEALKHYSSLTGGGMISLPADNIDKDQAHDIILEYRDLARKASRDQAALATVENEMTQLQLQLSEYNSDYQILSPPEFTLKSKTPSLPLSLFVGGSSGVALGILISLIVERLKGKVLSKTLIETALNTSQTITINQCNLKSWGASLQRLIHPVESYPLRILFAQSISTQSKEKIISFFRENSVHGLEVVDQITDYYSQGSYLYILALSPAAITYSELNMLQRGRSDSTGQANRNILIWIQDEN